MSAETAREERATRFLADLARQVEQAKAGVDWQARAEKAEALLEALDSALPDAAEVSVTPELVAALVALWGTWWAKITTLESDDPDYSLISSGDCSALDEVAQAVEKLMQSSSGGEERG